MPANQTSAPTAPRKRPRRGRSLLFLIAVCVLAGFALTRYMVRGTAAPSTFQATLEQGYPNISKAAVVAVGQIPGNQSMSADEVYRATAKDGLQRLDDAALMTLIRLRADLANRADPRACAALWSGENVNLVPTIERLPDDQQHQWALLFDQAAAATVNGIPIRPPPSALEYQQAFNRTMVGLGPSEFEQIENSVTRPDSQSPQDQCIAARLFFGRLSQMNNADALIVTRASLYR